MGYELHIHRSADDWLSAADAPIAPSEWLAVAEADSEIVRDGSSQMRRADGSVAEIPFFTYTPAGEEEGCGFSLDPEDGEISVSGPYHQQSRMKAFQIAEQLGARVQGDDMELYGPDGDVVGADRTHPTKRSLFGRLRGR